MSYTSFQQDIIKKNSEFYASQVEAFFTKAVELAMEKKFNEAIEFGNDALVLAKYANIGYDVLYLIGMLCEAYLDNDQPEIANDLFKRGMKIIDEGDDTYDRDLNQFLDLKIRIDEEFKKKHSEFYASQVEAFFTKAVELAMEKKFNEAIELGNDALVLAKHANFGYEVLYLIGMLCEAYLDNDQPEIANDLFKSGMKIIDEGDDTYDRDLNQFLDLKIGIDEELKKKNGL